MAEDFNCACLFLLCVFDRNEGGRNGCWAAECMVALLPECVINLAIYAAKSCFCGVCKEC